MHMIKKIGMLCVFMLAVFTLAGCKQREEKITGDLGEAKIAPENNIDNDTVILKVGKKEVTFSEAMFYVLCVKEQYEGYFGKDIWNVKFGANQTFEDMCKEDIINEIVQLKIITSKAEEQDVAVTADETDEIADTVREQLEEISDKDALRYGITKELLEAVYHDNYLSSKMFDVATGEVDTNISDEEARNADFQLVLVMTKGTNKNGEEISLNKKERIEAKKWARELRKQAVDAADFYAFASSYSDSEEIELCTGTGVKGEAFDEAAFSLKTGEISDVVRGEDGYYIIYCVNEMNEDATMAAKEKIINERQDAAFRDIYEDWSKEFKVTLEEDYWDKVTFVEIQNNDSGEADFTANKVGN